MKITNDQDFYNESRRLTKVWVKECNRDSDCTNDKRPDWLETALVECKRLYYITGISPLTDQAFDSQEENLKDLRPNSRALAVGYIDEDGE